MDCLHAIGKRVMWRKCIIFISLYFMHHHCDYHPKGKPDLAPQSFILDWSHQHQYRTTAAGLIIDCTTPWVWFRGLLKLTLQRLIGQWAVVTEVAKHNNNKKASRCNIFVISLLLQNPKFNWLTKQSSGLQQNVEIHKINRVQIGKLQCW